MGPVSVVTVPTSTSLDEIPGPLAGPLQTELATDRPCTPELGPELAVCACPAEPAVDAAAEEPAPDPAAWVAPEAPVTPEPDAAADEPEVELEPDPLPPAALRAATWDAVRRA